MARGGRGRSHGGHHFGGHHHHHGGRGGQSGAAGFEMTIDALAMNGIFTYTGNQMSAQAQIDNFPMMDQQHMEQTGGARISLATLTIVGSKTKVSNNCCFLLTMITGTFCIIPLFFLCCMWWKKIVYPEYVLADQVYRNLGRIVNRDSGVINLTLTVVDNAFNAQKARILYELLQNSNVKSFTFVNMALDCDYMESQSSNFVVNMQPIKSLGIPTNMVWGTTIA